MGRKRALVVKAPDSGDGSPDLGLPAKAIYMEKGTPYMHLAWRFPSNIKHYAVGEFLGMDGDDQVWLVVGTMDIASGLYNLPAPKRRILMAAWAIPEERELLLSLGVEERDGFPVPKHVLAGCSRVATGKDND